MSNGGDQPSSFPSHVFTPELAQDADFVLGAILSEPTRDELHDHTLNVIPTVEPSNAPSAPMHSTIIHDDMPTLIPDHAAPRWAHEDNNEAPHDDDAASMPDLQAMSDSSEDEVSGMVDDDGDPAWEDMDGPVNEGDGPPPLEPAGPPPLRSSERRARVEDAEDEEETGRPTRRQRLSGERSGSEPSLPMHIPLTATPNPTQPSSPPPPPRPFPFISPTQFFNSIPRAFNPGNLGLNAHTHNHGHQRSPQPPQSQPDATAAPHVTGPPLSPRNSGFGIAVAFDGFGNPIASFPLGGGPPPPVAGMTEGAIPTSPGPPLDENGAGPDEATLNSFVRAISAFIGMNMGARMEEKDDPERAKKLVGGLEVVPVGLVRRMERVGGTRANTVGGTLGASDEPGCAVCWEPLLDGEGDGFAPPPAEGASGSSTNVTLGESLGPPTGAALSDSSPRNDGSSTSEGDLLSPLAEKTYPDIIALPCSHVFHASCLIPWFSRPKHTTCPTCRFDVDPENLTYNPMRPVFTTTQAPPPPPTREAQPGATTVPTNPVPGLGPTPRSSAAPGDGAAQQEVPASTASNQPGAVPTPDTGGPPPQAQDPPVGFTIDISFAFEPIGPPSTQEGPGAPPNMPPGANGTTGLNFSTGFMAPAQFAAMMQRMMAGGPPPGANAGAPPAATGIAAAAARPFPAAPRPGPIFPGAEASAGAQSVPPMFFGPPPPPPPNPTGPHDNAFDAPPAAAGRPVFDTFNVFTFPPFMGPGAPRPPTGTTPFGPPLPPRERERRQWAPPPAPGPTVRQRVERRERELNLRCWSTSCAIGPSDEEPFQEVASGALKQVSVRRMPGNGELDGASGPTCEHTFHAECLVMAERVAGWDGEARDGTHVPVACPVCRVAGCVQKEEWTEGVIALA